VVDVVRAPIETKVIEEIKKPPPPPEIVLPPPPKLEAPPPPYIPPPEVQIATPPPPQTTITVAPSPEPPPPTVMTPTPPVVVAPPAPAPKPSVVAIGVACPTMVPPVTPVKAAREGITGTVKARATIKGGKVIAVEILSATPRGVYENAVRTAMMQYGCNASGDDEIKADQIFDFKLE
jgi:periplasmic protein TonB